MKKNILKLATLLLAVVSFTSCLDDDNDTPVTPEHFDYTAGAYVLNEGSYYSKINGSLDYLDYSTNTYTKGVFQSANGRSLGGTPNDLVIYGNKMYIACTDENRVEVVDKHTVKALAPKGVSITQPRHLTAGGGYVYVTSYDGTVSKIDTTSFAVAEKSEKIGDYLEDITYLNGALYVCDAYNVDANYKYTYNTNVVKLSASSLTKAASITVNANPNQIENDGTNVYVLSWGDYGAVASAIQKIDGMSNQVSNVATNASAMALADGYIYYYATTYDANWNATYKYTMLNLKDNTTTDLSIGNYIESPASMYIDPINGFLFVGSRPVSGGKVSYTDNGYVMLFSNAAQPVKFSAGVGPTHMAFVVDTYNSK